MRKSASDLFIVDNSDADWKVRSYLTCMVGWLPRKMKPAVGRNRYRVPPYGMAVVSR